MPAVNRIPVPLLVVGVLLAISLAATVATGLAQGPTASPGPSAVGEVPTATPDDAPTTQPSSSPGPSDEPEPTTSADPNPSASADAPSAPATEALIVPVTQFRTARASTDRDEVADVLAGRSDRYEALELVEGEAEAILAALDLAAPDDPDRLILAADAAALRRDMAKQRDRLAFLRVEDVTPAVRALAWGSRSLFGGKRVRDLADWRLTADLPPTDEPAYDPATTWTLFAGGDILLDRGVHETIEVNGKGADFPFDGGTADITSRYCCSSFGWELPRVRRTGDKGAMRELISSADIAMANFENPAPNKARWHTSGTVFSAQPKFIDGLVDAGIDYVGIANNHIGDAGRAGIIQTIRNLKSRGLKYSGAGKDEATARRPATFDVGGTTVAILAYDRIARYYFADADTAGSAPLSAKRVATDIKKARADGADVVIVFPHWGTEYRDDPFEAQQDLAHRIIDAGADMIIGNHAHWAAAMEVYEGKPIWYALGNFVFDQTWSEPTMEGITLELTFRGQELAQVRMRPHIILDKAQPNFLDPARDGRVVMGQVFDASKGLLPW